MKLIMILLIPILSLFAEETYINPTNNTVNGGGTINNNVYVQQPVRVDTIIREVRDTLVVDIEGSVVRSPRTFIPKNQYLLKTVGVQYAIPLIQNGVVSNDNFMSNGFGVKMYMLFQPSPTPYGYIGFRVGYSTFPNILVENYPDDYDIHQFLNATQGNVVDTTTPTKDYQSFEICAMIGGKRLQGILGYGILMGESNIILGVNFDTYTKVGLNFSFNNFIGNKTYAPELGVGISLSL